MNLGQFFGIAGAASNIVSENISVYTEEMFKEDFPQFTKKEESGTHVCLVPSTILLQFISMANAAIQEARWFEKWRFAMGLYIAHYSALYLKSYAPESKSAGEAANSGALLGLTSSASLGDASVSYDNKAIIAATEKWGALNSTSYGQLLVTEARLVSMGGSFII